MPLGINSRLETMYGAVRDNVALPIIVRTKAPVDNAILAQARQAGAGSISSHSEFDHTYSTKATYEVARRLAQLPVTQEVFPDEPLYAL